MSSSTLAQNAQEPIPWRYSTRGIAIRIFFTCWIVYSLHFATNIVREIYPALALGDHLSFRVDEYAGMHPDIFEKPGYGWHIGNNPGASMLAAIPYALSRPIIDPIVNYVKNARASSGQMCPARYHRISCDACYQKNSAARTGRRGPPLKRQLPLCVYLNYCRHWLGAMPVPSGHGLGLVFST